MAHSHRESHHRDGITDQKSLQQISATKSAKLGHNTRLFDHSARAKIVCGTLMPSALAVLKLPDLGGRQPCR
jgi:hypothetical protein